MSRCKILNDLINKVVRLKSEIINCDHLTETERERFSSKLEDIIDGLYGKDDSDDLSV
jgi:hypothetical protein